VCEKEIKNVATFRLKGGKTPILTSPWSSAGPELFTSENRPSISKDTGGGKRVLYEKRKGGKVCIVEMRIIPRGQTKRVTPRRGLVYMRSLWNGLWKGEKPDETTKRRGILKRRGGGGRGGGDKKAEGEKGRGKRGSRGKGGGKGVGGGR